MATLVEELSAFGLGQMNADLPPAVAKESKRILLDSIGCGIAALGTDKGKLAVQYASAAGGAGEASIPGVSAVFSASGAAFANGELINLLDYDVVTGPPGHVAPYVIPAVLAAAEKHHRSGRDLMRAVAVAHEVSVRFGRAMSDVRDVAPGEKMTFPAVTGYSSTIFGGALGASMLAGLRMDQTASALGLAGHIAPAQSMGKWVRTMPASTDKYLMAGWISQGELLSVDLAELGYHGDVEVLEGDYGFWRYMGSARWIPAALTEQLGSLWQFPKVSEYKPYPHCRISHTVLDCLYHLMAAHGLTAEEMERIDVYCDPHGALMPMWSSKDIVSCLDAQMSTPFAISLAAHKVPVGPIWQAESTMRDPRILKFMDKVTVQAHPNFENVARQTPGSRIGKIDVFARGQRFSEVRTFRKGSPASEETKLTDAELAAKFRVNAEGVLAPNQIDEIIRRIAQLEEVTDVTTLSKLWTTGQMAP